MGTGRAHGKAVPGWLDPQPGVGAEDHEVGKLGRAAALRGKAGEDDEVVEQRGQGGERLAAGQPPAALDGRGRGVGQATPRGAPEPLLGGDGVNQVAMRDGAHAHALEPGGGVGRRVALLAERLQVHHEGQRRGTIGAGNRFEDGEIRAE